jgi:hypothetical protein
MNQVIKLGSSGLLVECIQEKLNLKITGVYDGETHKEVVRFQASNNIKNDGIVGPLTWKKLKIFPEEIYADTDANTSATWITQYPLPHGEFVDEDTNKQYVILHSNHGTYDPYKQIDLWAHDQRGRVGSHYVIGGLSPAESTDYKKVDGLILQAIKDYNWGFHLGPIKQSRLQKNSITIELCSAGPLTFTDGKYSTWYGLEVVPEQVESLEVPFKGHRYFHKYSEAQLESLKALLILIRNRHNIDLKTGLLEMLKSNTKDAFNYSKRSLNYHSGIFTHGNLVESKLDLFPQKSLINMLETL